MIVDRFGQHVYTPDDIFAHYMRDIDSRVERITCSEMIDFDSVLELEYRPNIRKYIESDETIEEYDKRLQSEWHMPAEYKQLDIVKYILDKCKTDEELDRVGNELLLYQEYGMFDLLRYLVYLVDIMRKHDIVWGVGRGSSVASYVLYLIGIHRINSIQYHLDIREFLK